MQLDEAQAQLLKTWIVKKLENLSDTDADPDVLAEYVLELVRGDESPAAVRQSCIDNLQDFLQESTTTFVDEFVKALQSKSYDPAQARVAHPPSGPRKRTLDDRGDDTAPNGRFQSAPNRPVKQARRGARGGFDRGAGRQAQQSWQPPQFQPGSMPPMNPQDALEALMAMQQALGLPPMPGMLQNGQGGAHRSRQRCRDYDTKGFCARGASCKFEHGSEAVVVGNDYDPAQALMMPLSDYPAERGGANGRARASGRGRGGQGRGTGRRAEFSLAGPSQDRSLTALVVEQIPEDKFDEQQIRDFFTQYGTIQEIELQPHRRLAIVTFGSWDEANAAYTSPKVIFDNRFVKVFWHKPGGDVTHGQHAHGEPQDTEMKNAVPQIDHEEIAKRQEEAQKKHEEARKQRDEAQRQKADIDAKLKAMEEERRKFTELLAKKANKAVPAQSGVQNATAESEQTKGLKAQLAKLEAEAKSLGIDPNAATNEWQDGQTWRGRGGYRGRGRFATRGSFRGGWAGAPSRGGAVKRLDNRPRTLSVAFPDGAFDKYDEAMRQYLLFSNNLEHATLSRHPDREDAAMVTFEERYRAENFKAAATSGIPNIGTVEVSWMANPIKPSTESVKSGIEDTPMSAVDSAPVTEGEADYDIAEDDQWA